MDESETKAREKVEKRKIEGAYRTIDFICKC